MIPRYVFDTGALIGAEKGKKRAVDYVALAQRGRAEIVTPIVCVVEWWRGRTDARDALLRAIVVEPLPLGAAKAAGVALAGLGARAGAALSIDAAVAAFAVLLDAPVVTADVDDFDRLRAWLPGLRLLTV
jgi:predicted nucleic acid-binding protein